MIETVTTKKVYHLSWLAYSGLLLLDLVVFFATIEGFLSLLQSSQSGSLTTDIIMTTLFTGTGIFALSFFWVLYRIRLVLTEDGIAFYTWGCRMYTPWHNIVGIERVRNGTIAIILRSFTSLRLRQNYIYGMKIEEGRRRGIAVLETDWWIPASSMRMLGYIFPIITYIGGHHWLYKALGRDIQRYAPWLFAQQHH